MILSIAYLTLLCLCSLGQSQLPSQAASVNIHFTEPAQGEMELLAATGWNFIRMDFFWAGIERTKGIYDFNSYDILYRNLATYSIRPLWILDYSNPLYDNGESPHTPEGIAAFANFARAAVLHFKGKGVIWEMWNEPNIGFWKPTPNVTAYSALALAVGKAIKGVAPDEIYVGPATSTIDFNFIEAVFKAGLLEYFDAVSVHPYRDSVPETVTLEWNKLKNLINQYKPKNKDVPVISSEWGYSTLYPHLDLILQSKFLPREILTNWANGVILSTWYDWHDDCISNTNAECNFGTVYNTYHPGRDPVYDLKPTYKSAKTLLTTLRGHVLRNHYLFSEAITILGFENPRTSSSVIVGWTSSANQTFSIPEISNTCYSTLDYLGSQGPNICSANSKLQLPLTDSPLYLLRV